jgi:hypothetical protein
MRFCGFSDHETPKRRGSDAGGDKMGKDERNCSDMHGFSSAGTRPEEIADGIDTDE